jgi:4-amino-4-deoxy-L-arabinose transferase-like glycosyltransferase
MTTDLGPEVVLYRAQHFWLNTVFRPGARPGQRANPNYRPSGHTRMLPKVMPNQGDRVASSETRLMPKVELPDDVKQKLKPLPIPGWLEVVFIFLGLVASLIAHAYNMFNFPRYELDEGTYMASAWAIWNGMLQPTAYGYGHPPLAWIQIAGGIPLTGGFFTFGNAINTGRVIMLFYALGSGLLVYLITRHLSSSRSAGLLAMVMFSLSPLAVTYQRQIYLDNIATFWLLFSLYLLVVGKSRLIHLTLSAISLGIAILSKEVFALFIPAMIYAVWLHTTTFQRKFAMVAFTYAVISVCSAFVLMATLKGELFPPGVLPWDKSQHLSLIGTYLSQAQRGSNEGSFAGSWANWLSGDIILMACAVIAPVLNLLVGWWNRKQLLMALLAISYWLLLVRGGVVLTFYIIPLVPLVVINVAMLVQSILKWVSRLFYFDLMRIVLILFAAILLVPYCFYQGGYNYSLHASSIQNEAMTWTNKNIPRNSVIICSTYMWLDLRLPGGMGVGKGAGFQNALIYDTAGSDPEIYEGILGNNWDRIDYFIADSQMIGYIAGNPQASPDNPEDIKAMKSQESNPDQVLLNAFKHSKLVAFFQTEDHGNKFDIKIFQVQHKVPPPQL